ncbi:MAG: hypothetical protein ACK5QW_09820 [Cyanobacteriota bacterium]
MRKFLHDTDVNLIFDKLDVKAWLLVEVQPHMLCHAYGFVLAVQCNDAGLLLDDLGHRDN